MKDDADAFRMEFSRRLTNLVEIRGYPKNNFGRNKKLAAELDISEPYVYKLFNGQMGSPQVLVKIAALLNTTSDYLLGLTDKDENPHTTVSQKELTSSYWRPVEAGDTGFEITPPKTDIKGQKSLKGIWAYKRTRGSYSLELVIYDSSTTQPVDGQPYVMQLDGDVQIRTVEWIDEDQIAVWLDPQDISNHLHWDRETNGLAPEQGRILGRVVARISPAVGDPVSANEKNSSR